MRGGGELRLCFFFTLKTSKEKIRTWEDFWFWAGFLHFWRPWFGLIRFIGCFLRVLDKKTGLEISFWMEKIMDLVFLITSVMDFGILDVLLFF